MWRGFAKVVWKSESLSLHCTRLNGFGRVTALGVSHQSSHTVLYMWSKVSMWVSYHKRSLRCKGSGGGGLAVSSGHRWRECRPRACRGRRPRSRRTRAGDLRSPWRRCARSRRTWHAPGATVPGPYPATRRPRRPPSRRAPAAPHSGPARESNEHVLEHQHPRNPHNTRTHWTASTGPSPHANPIVFGRQDLLETPENPYAARSLHVHLHPDTNSNVERPASNRTKACINILLAQYDKRVIVNFLFDPLNKWGIEVMIESMWYFGLNDRPSSLV